MYSLGDFESTFIGGENRQYDYNQIVGGLYEVYPEEMSLHHHLKYNQIQPSNILKFLYHYPHKSKIQISI